MGTYFERRRITMALPFKKGNVVKYESGYCANVMNVLDNAIIVDQDNSG